MNESASTRLCKRTLSSAEAWPSAPLSQRSCFGDHLWQFDIGTAGRRPCHNRLDWDTALADGSRLTDPQYATLLSAAKQFLWSMVNDPPRGHKRWSPSTLCKRGRTLIVILRWMIAEGYRSFAALDDPALQRLQAWLTMRQVARTERPIAPATILHYLQVLKDLYRQQAKLADALRRDPLPRETTYEAAGLTPATKGWIPFIPDAVASLNWIAHPEPILAARNSWHATFAASKASGNVRPRVRARIALKLKNLRGPKGEAIDGAHVMHRLVTHLTDACFIAIAGLVGMRVSEILSMETGCIEMRPIGETTSWRACSKPSTTRAAASSVGWRRSLSYVRSRSSSA
jgi:hypothetical protein